MTTPDRDKTRQMGHLLKTPPAAQDEAWQAHLNEVAVSAAYVLDEPDVMTGPDQFRYLVLRTPTDEPDEALTCLGALAARATEEGLGVAINPAPTQADWVLSYGDLVTLRHFQCLAVPSEDPTADGMTRQVIQEEEQALVSAPSEYFLPRYARRVLAQHFRTELKQNHPGVLLLSRRSVIPPQQLVFSVFSDQFSNNDELALVLERISWHLPKHYVITCVQQNSQLRDNFFPLDDGESAEEAAPAPTSSTPQKKPWYQFWS